MVMNNTNVILDVENTVNAVRKTIENGTHEEKVTFFDQMDDLREEMGVGRDIYASQLFDYHIGAGIVNKTIDSIQEENRDNWITVADAAERRNVSENTVRNRIGSAFDVRMLANEDNKLVQHVNVMQVDAEYFAPSFNKGKKKQQHSPTKREATKRRRLVMRVLNDRAEHSVQSVVYQLLDECNFTGKYAKENALSLVNALVNEKKIDWRSSDGYTLTPRMNDYIFLPESSRMNLFASREATVW
jgi:hypothetical protein